MSYPIRAVCIYDGLILAARGLQLLLFNSATHDLVQSVNVSKTVFFIKRCYSHSNTLFVSFGKSFRILRIDVVNKESCFCDVEFVNDEVYLKYWILDFCSTHFSNHDSIKDEESISQTGLSTEFFILLSQNFVVQFNLPLWRVSKVFTSNMPCILYCGLLVPKNFHKEDMNYKDVVLVFGGTVFNTVLLWMLTDSAESGCKTQRLTQKCCVIVEFKGHSGVIFNLDFCSATNTLLTASDDRSVRIWNLPQLDCDVKSDYSCDSFKHSRLSVNSLKSFFCHKARVQKVRFVDEYIVTVGEDCQVCILTRSELVKSFTAHRGLNVFGLDVCANHKYFITAGEDGSLLKWDLKSVFEPLASPSCLLNAKCESEIRLVKILSSSKVFFLTTKGELFVQCVSISEEKPAQLIAVDKRIAAYAVCDFDPQLNVLVFGTLQGCVFSFFNFTCQDPSNKDVESKNNTSSLPVCSTKITSIHVVGPYVVASSMQKRLIVLRINESSSCLDQIAELNWPITKNNWPNCCSWFTQKEVLACGDRNGTVWVYDTNQFSSKPLQEDHGVLEPCQVLTRCHSKLGVTFILANPASQTLMTSGRDGKINIYTFSSETNEYKSPNLLLSRVFQLHGSIEWVAKLAFTDNNNKLLAFCFKSDNFVVVDVENNSRILGSFLCGGGHRSFDLSLNSDVFHFVYLQRNVIKRVSGNLSFSSPFKSLLPPLHGSKIHCVCSIQANNQFYIVTGAEDCTIKVSLVTDILKNWTSCVATIETNPSAVRFIKVVSITEARYLILVFGSRSLHSIYKLEFSRDEVSKIDVLLMFTETSLSQLEASDDCKYLAADYTWCHNSNLLYIVKASSNGLLHCSLCDCTSLFKENVVYSNSLKLENVDTFIVKNSLNWSVCLNVVKIVSSKIFDNDHVSQTDSGISSKIFVLVGDNYGRLLLFELSQTNNKQFALVSELNLSDTIGRITCLDLSSQSDHVLIGGDSGSLALCEIGYSKSIVIELVSVVKRCHAAQIVSCFLSFSRDQIEENSNGFYPNLVSVSIDQTVKCFRLNRVNSSDEHGENCEFAEVTKSGTESFQSFDGAKLLKWSKLIGIEDPSCSSIACITPSSHCSYDRCNVSSFIVIGGHGVSILDFT